MRSGLPVAGAPTAMNADGSFIRLERIHTWLRDGAHALAAHFDLAVAPGQGARRS